MPGDDEFTGPVGYSSLWLWLALGIFGLVVLGYLAVLLWSLGGRPKKPRPADLPSVRNRAMGELDRIGHQVHTGQLTARAAFQQMSGVVRGFVSDASGLPARSMSLADLRQVGAPHLAETIALMYPPEFAPETSSTESLHATLDRARGLVSSWS